MARRCEMKPQSSFRVRPGFLNLAQGPPGGEEVRMDPFLHFRSGSLQIVTVREPLEGILVLQLLSLSAYSHLVLQANVNCCP
jgi:hypothetical protein